VLFSHNQIGYSIAQLGLLYNRHALGGKEGDDDRGNDAYRKSGIRE
jgi:hypothetical protein